MVNEANCPECSGPVVVKHVNSTQTLTCLVCGWSVATTYLAPIDEDRQQYQLFIKKLEQSSLNELRAIAAIINQNFVQTRHLLYEHDILAFQGEAADVLPMKNKLDNEEIAYFIHPDFNY